jgi:hypothetical protein
VANGARHGSPVVMVLVEGILAESQGCDVRTQSGRLQVAAKAVDSRMGVASGGGRKLFVA